MANDSKIFQNANPAESGVKVVSVFESVIANVERLTKQIERQKTEIKTLTEKKSEQAQQIKTQREELQDLKQKIKEFEKNEKTLNKTLKNYKEFPNIVKNPENIGNPDELKKKLDSYIRYIEETILLLKTI
jgi:septal ring factor EnvC (AmiA/AmiB activator)